MYVRALRHDPLRKSTPSCCAYAAVSAKFCPRRSGGTDGPALGQLVWQCCGGGCCPPISGGPGAKIGGFSRICELRVAPSNKFEFAVGTPASWVAGPAGGFKHWPCICAKVTGKPGGGPCSSICCCCTFAKARAGGGVSVPPRRPGDPRSRLKMPKVAAAAAAVGTAADAAAVLCGHPAS